MLKNKKMLPIVAILLIIVIAGIIMLNIKGMNYGLIYGNNATIKMSLDIKPELDDIVKEIFGSQYNIKSINSTENNIVITVKSTSSDQINELIAKTNEKYNLSITNEDIEIINNPKISGKDLVLPYLTPAIVVFVLILIYFIIRYKKVGILQILTTSLITIVGVQLLYLSIYALVRIPVNQLTMPISVLLFVVSFIVLIEVYERKIVRIKKSQKAK